MSLLSLEESAMFWEYELISPTTIERAKHLVEDMLTRAKSSSSASDKSTVRITLNGEPLPDAAGCEESDAEDLGRVWSLDSLGKYPLAKLALGICTTNGIVPDLDEDNDASFEVLNRLTASSICHAFDNPSLCPGATPEVANTDTTTVTNLDTTKTFADTNTDSSLHCFVVAINDLSTRAPYMADVLQRAGKQMSRWGQMERALLGTPLEEVHGLVSRAFKVQIAHTRNMEDNKWESQVERISSQRKLRRATFLAETQIARLTDQEQKAWDEVIERCEEFWSETETERGTESQEKLKSSEVTEKAWCEFERLMSEMGVDKEKRIQSACKEFVRQITEAVQ